MVNEDKKIIKCDVNEAMERVFKEAATHTIMSQGDAFTKLQNDERGQPRSGYTLQTLTPLKRIAIENSLAVLEIKGIDKRNPGLLKITGNDVLNLWTISNPVMPAEFVAAEKKTECDGITYREIKLPSKVGAVTAEAHPAPSLPAAGRTRRPHFDLGSPSGSRMAG